MKQSRGTRKRDCPFLFCFVRENVNLDRNTSHPHATLTFILLCKGLCLIPQIKGLKDVGREVDIGGGHVLDGDWGTDGGRHPTAPHAANT